MHPALRCDGVQGVSWGLPPPCELLLSYTRSLQQVLKGHWVRLGTGTGTKGAEGLVREGWCERAELLAAGLARVGATSLATAPGCLFPSTLNAGAALGTVCPGGGQELQSVPPAWASPGGTVEVFAYFASPASTSYSGSRAEGVRTAPKPSLLGAYETTVFLFIILIRPVLADVFIADLEEGVNSMLMTFSDDDKTGFCLSVGMQKNNTKGTSEVRKTGRK